LLKPLAWFNEEFTARRWGEPSNGSEAMGRVLAVCLGWLMALALWGAPAWSVADEGPQKAPAGGGKRDALPGTQEQRDSISRFLESHVAAVNGRDIDAYLGGLVDALKRDPNTRAYVARVMALPELEVEMVGIEFRHIRERFAVVTVVQRATYIGEDDQPMLDEAELTFRLNNVGESWQITSTERRRWQGVIEPLEALGDPSALDAPATQSPLED